MSRKWEWIGDPADVLTGFTGDGGQQYGAHLLEFPERKVRVPFPVSLYLPCAHPQVWTCKFFKEEGDEEGGLKLE